MALIKCNECDGSVSTNASKCPHCGNPSKFFSVKSRELGKSTQSLAHSINDQKISSSKIKIIDSLTKFWGLNRIEHSQWKSELLFWLSLVGILASLIIFSSKLFEKPDELKKLDRIKELAESSDSPPKTFLKKVDPLEEFQQIKIRQFNEAKQLMLSGVPRSKEKILQDIQELRNCLKDFNSDLGIFLELELQGREYMADVTFRNGVTKSKFVKSYQNQDIIDLNKLEREELLNLAKERLELCKELLAETIHVARWLKDKIETLRLNIPKSHHDRIIKTEEIMRSNISAEEDYLISIVNIQNFLLTAFFKIENGQIFFYDDPSLDTFNLLSTEHNSAAQNYLAASPL